MKQWFVVCAFLAIVGCSKKQDGGPAAAGSAEGAAAEATGAGAVDRTETPEFKALQKNVTINQLSHAAEKIDPASWPSDDVPSLDFTNETGNALLVLRKAPGGFEETLINAPKFRLFHTEDDPYRVTQYVNDIGLPEGETKATYQDKQYAPALQAAVRAKYAVLLTLELARPDLNSANNTFAGGVVSGKGVLYELESQKLLGGIVFKAGNSEQIMVMKGATTSHASKLVHDLEKNTREALRKAVLARFPSAKVPNWTYYEVD